MGSRLAATPMTRLAGRRCAGRARRAAATSAGTAPGCTGRTSLPSPWCRPPPPHPEFGYSIFTGPQDWVDIDKDATQYTADFPLPDTYYPSPGITFRMAASARIPGRRPLDRQRQSSVTSSCDAPAAGAVPAVPADAVWSAMLTVDEATGGFFRYVGCDSLTFAPGETQKTVEVAALADEAGGEGEERFALLLSEPSGATLADGEAAGAIADVAPGEKPAPLAALTASVSSAPAEHTGKGKFSVRIAFSAPLTERARKALRGGAVRQVRRVDDARDVWSVRLAPDGLGAVTLRLAPSGPCGEPGAICTADGRRLAEGLAHTVPGPVTLAVADARAKEGVDETIDFAVTLSRAATRPRTSCGG